MTRQPDRVRSTILLLVTSAVVGYITTFTAIHFNAKPSGHQDGSASVPLAEGSVLAAGSVLEVNGNSSCRQVIGKGLYLYGQAGQFNTSLQRVRPGQQVGLLNGTNAVQGADGLPYIYVSVPYADQNPQSGYLQAQVRDADTGNPQSTLGMCDSSSGFNGGNGPNNGGFNNGQGAVSASW